jgi:putative protease
VVYEETGGRVLLRLGGVTRNSFAHGEPAAYPTPCKGRVVSHGRASYLFEEAVGLNAILILPELKGVGITALKIEGRQRSRTYVAALVTTFRRALDALGRGDDRTPTG